MINGKVSWHADNKSLEISSTLNGWVAEPKRLDYTVTTEAL